MSSRTNRLNQLDFGDLFRFTLSFTYKIFLLSGRGVNKGAIYCSSAVVRTGGIPDSLPAGMAIEGSEREKEVGSVESRKERYSLPKKSLRSKVRLLPGIGLAGDCSGTYSVAATSSPSMTVLSGVFGKELAPT